jgi:hypothetical protein
MRRMDAILVRSRPDDKQGFFSKHFPLQIDVFQSTTVIHNASPQRAVTNDDIIKNDAIFQL